MYWSGEGYKWISRKDYIIEKRKWGTTVTSPRTWCSFKMDRRTRRNLIREATKRPTATLKKLQKYLTSTDYCLHVVTISLILSYLWRVWLDRSVVSLKQKSSTGSPPKSLQIMRQINLWSGETKVELFGFNCKRLKKMSYSTKWSIFFILQHGKDTRHKTKSAKNGFRKISTF